MSTVVTLSREEGYELTKRYVGYYWATNKFYSLKNKYEQEDLVHEVYIKFLSRGLFEKYNSNITSKEYHVMNAVKNALIDELKKYRECYSLEKEDENGITLGDKIQSEISYEEQSLGEMRKQEILSQIPKETDSKLVGNSPELGECNFSLYTIAYHLDKGYSTDEIAKMFHNKNSGKPVTKGRVQQLITSLREYCLNNIVLYQ